MIKKVILDRRKAVTLNRGRYINFSVTALFLSIGVCIIVWWATLGLYKLIITTMAWAVISYILPDEAFEVFTNKAEWLRSTRRSRILLSLGFSVSFATTGFLSGIFTGNNQILPYVLIGSMHLHHWFTSSLRLAFLLPIFKAFSLKKEDRNLFYKKRSRVEFKLATAWAIILITTFLKSDWFPNITSARMLSSIYMGVSIGLGLLLRSDAPQAPGFRRVMVLFLGIALGILAEGLVGLMKTGPESILF